MRPKVGDIVAVEWSDAWFDQDETTAADWKDNMNMTTHGVLARDGEVVTVVGEPADDGRGRATTHIPRAIVRRIRVLERKGDK